MKYPIISKETFCKYIDTISKTFQKEEKITKFFREIDEESDISFLTLYSTERQAMIKMLEDIMQDKQCPDIGSNIEYFLYDLDCGKNYRPGAIIDVDGCDIIMKTAENLYDFLVDEYYKRHPNEVFL